MCVSVHNFLLFSSQVGSNIPEAITEKRGRCNYPIQLYILAVGDSNKFHSLILVLGTLPLRALDLLFKLHFVLQSHLVLGWKNVFRFLQIHVSKVPITADQAKNRHSTFVEQFKEIMSQNWCTYLCNWNIVYYFLLILWNYFNWCRLLWSSTKIKNYLLLYSCECKCNILFYILLIFKDIVHDVNFFNCFLT